MIATGAYLKARCFPVIILLLAGCSGIKRSSFLNRLTDCFLATDRSRVRPGNFPVQLDLFNFKIARQQNVQGLYGHWQETSIGK